MKLSIEQQKFYPCILFIHFCLSYMYFTKLFRAASIIEGPTVCTEELRSVLSWPSLQCRRDYLKCVLVFKCLHNLAPSYLLSEFKHAYEFHSFNTRNRDLLRFPFARTTKYQGSFRINGARTFNSLPRNSRLTEDLSKFKSEIKRHFKQL